MIELVQQEEKDSSSVKESLDDLFPTDEEEQTQSKRSSFSTDAVLKPTFELVKSFASQVYCHVHIELVNVQIQRQIFKLATLNTFI